jgi:hypothetical protein
MVNRVRGWENKGILFNLLTGASDAHHAYEEHLGHPDENWADWYAQHMATAMHAAGYAFVKIEEEN